MSCKLWKYAETNWLYQIIMHQRCVCDKKDVWLSEKQKKNKTFISTDNSEVIDSDGT